MMNHKSSRYMLLLLVTVSCTMPRCLAQQASQTEIASAEEIALEDNIQHAQLEIARRQESVQHIDQAKKSIQQQIDQIKLRAAHSPSSTSRLIALERLLSNDSAAEKEQFSEGKITTAMDSILAISRTDDQLESARRSN